MQKHSLLFTFFALFSTALWGQFQVTPGNQAPYNPQNLVSNFLTNSGINVLNVTYNGAPAAVGFFNQGTGVIGLERGIVMSTGKSEDADGDGSDFSSSINNGPTTEPHLASVANGSSLYDVAVYAITFQSYNDTMLFRYVFASEEYPEYACSQFNDIFGFFLEGPGMPVGGQNIALIPNTNLPVSINTVHPNNPVSSPCPAQYDQYYNNNVNSSLPPTYDGYLDVFEAKAAVLPCETYTMYIAIADVGDAIYDSAVFLEANSFGSGSFVAASVSPGNNALPETATALPVQLQFSQVPASVLPLTITIEGAAENGVDYEPISATYTISTPDSLLEILVQPIADSLEEEVETVLIKVTGGTCFIKSYELFITDPGVVFSNAVDTIYWANTSITLDATESFFSAGETFSFQNDQDSTLSVVYNSYLFPIAVDIPAFGQKTTNAEMFSANQKLTNLNMISSVCFNINHPWVDDLDVYLVSPDGKFVELTTDNGGNGDNYTNTCFSPSATQPINYGLPFAPPSAAPFTGTFQPEGKWEDLLGSPLNGNWYLSVVDDNSTAVGTIKDWSITFDGSAFQTFQYVWSTGATTSSIEVDAPGFYTVTITNAVSRFEKTYHIRGLCGNSVQNYTVCSGGAVTVNGITYNAAQPSGTQTIANNGCDSLVFIQLNILPPVQTTENATICASETYTWNNQTLTAAGVYTANLTTVNGCDSVAQLQLTVLPAVQTTENATICASETYTWNNQTLTAAGVYTANLTTVNGCDSVAQLQLAVLPTTSDSLSFVISINETVEVGGQIFSQPGDYTITIAGSNGCDSTLYINIQLISGTHTPNVAGAVQLMPNPVTEMLTVTWPESVQLEQLELYSIDNKRVYQTVLTGTSITIPMAQMAPGWYVLRLSGGAQVVCKKVMKVE